MGRQHTFISVDEAKRVTPRVKHIDIAVFLILQKSDNGIFVPKYDKSGVMPADICTKPFQVQLSVG